MLVYSSERFVAAYVGACSYDRDVREAICASCGKSIGEQVKYYMDKRFTFKDTEKNRYKFCPYCGEPFDVKENNHV